MKNTDFQFRKSEIKRIEANSVIKSLRAEALKNQVEYEKDLVQNNDTQNYILSKETLDMLFPESHYSAADRLEDLLHQLDMITDLNCWTHDIFSRTLESDFLPFVRITEEPCYEFIDWCRETESPRFYEDPECPLTEKVPMRISFLGQYFPGKKKVVIYINEIRRFATLHKISFEALFFVVLFHEIGHYLSHCWPMCGTLGWDIDDYDKSDTNLHECLAQLVAYWISESNDKENKDDIERFKKRYKEKHNTPCPQLEIDKYIAEEICDLKQAFNALLPYQSSEYHEYKNYTGFAPYQVAQALAEVRRLHRPASLGDFDAKIKNAPHP